VQITDQMFNDWVRQHQRLLFGIAYWWTGSRTDAEELTQEAFLQAYRSRSSPRDVELVKGWLVGILRHCHSQMRRRTKSREEVSFDEMLYEPQSRPTLSADALALHQSLEKIENGIVSRWSCSTSRISPIGRSLKRWNFRLERSCPDSPAQGNSCMS
jgi:RNA polymerase sigma-70 factor, ECF subfamily